MANLVDPSNKENKSFNPNVDNTKRNAEASIFGKTIWYLLFLLIIPIIIHVVKRNSLLKSQMKINETASGIDVQLKKRRDTLVKLVDATKSYIKYERSTLTDLTKLRKATFEGGKDSGKLEALSAKILAVAENYPNLKADSLAKETMEEAAYLEREIGAARRLYNSEVTMFNSNLFIWPTNVVASSMRLSTLPLFRANEKDKEDVKLEF
ncbi:MAG: LemA family protein [Mycoplasmatales bacterium]|nr:LemA family protein [Mycoplasmatales bacterium]